MDSHDIIAAAFGEGDSFNRGRWTPAADGRTFTVVDPATAEPIRDVSSAGAAEANAAVDAAEAAGAAWAAAAPRTRSEILYRAHQSMLDQAEELSALIVTENGKSYRDARAEVVYAAEFFRWFAEEAVRIGSGFGDAPAGGFRHVIRKIPVGITAHVTSWNLPAAMATRKIAPALAAGCTVLLKPAPDTPLTALAVAHVLAEAGLPDGVLNVLPTDRAAEVVAVWMADERVRKVSFTGSTTTGKLLLKQAAATVKNTTMELGGNAPFLVLHDADVDSAIHGAMDAKMRGGGQVCTAANRFYVHRNVAAEFIEKFSTAMTSVKAGPGLADGTELSPIINQAAVDKISALVADAVARGATIAAQGSVPADTRGYYYPATVLTEVPADARIMDEEVFGPVAPITVFSDEEKAVAMANNSPYDLVSYVYSRDVARALRVAESIEAGMVGDNRGLLSDTAAPFGGVKQSGLGCEGGHDGIDAFQETRYIALDWPTTSS